MNKINTKICDDKYIFSFNGYEIHFCKFDITEARASLWNIWGIFKDGEVVCSAGTDIIGVLREVNEKDFMGGVHGDETNVDVHVLADGVPVTQDNESQKIDIVMFSHLTRVSSGENIIDRTVHIEIENNSITVTTSFLCLVDDFKLDIAYCGGMFAWFQDLCEYSYSNLGPIPKCNDSAPKALSSNKSINHVVCKIPYSFITVENISGKERDSYNGTIYYYGNEKRPRIKIYFSCDKNNTWNKGHVCSGKAKYTLL